MINIGDYSEERDFYVDSGVIEPSIFGSDNYNSRSIGSIDYDYIAKRTIGTIQSCLKDGLNFNHGDNFYCIGVFNSPMYYCRNNNDDRFIYDDDRGIKSLGLYHGKNNDIKNQTDLLLPNHGIGIIAKCAINENFNEKLVKTELTEFTAKSVIDIILEYGGDLNHLTRAKNDLFYNGKKFFGNELMVSDSGYAECCVLTCEYLPEKELFNKLNNFKDNITGITEEVPSVTRELLISELKSRITRLMIDRLR